MHNIGNIMNKYICNSCKCLIMVGPENYVCSDWGINIEDVPEDGCMGYSCKTDNIVTAEINNNSKMVTAVDVNIILLLDGDNYYTVKEYIKLLINGGDTE